MKMIFHAHDLAKISEVGGKGHHLQKLVGWGAKVAPFMVVSTSAYDEFIKLGQIPLKVSEAIKDFISLHKKIVLRSSMIGEDQLDASFAGLFETILDVDESNWEDALKKIYASMSSPRVLHYISQKNIRDELKMAVVVQKEIRVEKSGVTFTRSPMEPTSALAIDAAWGMGEGVVSGHVDVDTYLFNRLGELIQGEANTVLTALEMQELFEESLRLEKAFGRPADIEWGFDSRELYIFQIRAITRAFPPLKALADTNLSESYPGSVSPYTAEFVKKAYENVFLEAAGILGYQGHKLQKISGHCAQLISAVDDHLYYDIEHYYAVLRSLPGGEKNIENWHKMIGGKIKGLEIPFHDTTLSTHDLVQSIFSILQVARKKNRIYPWFLRDLESLSVEIQQDVAGLKNSKQTIHYLCGLMNRPLGFGITIVNDFFIMLGLGFLSSRLKKKNLAEDAVIDLLKTTHALDSVKPLHAFNSLVKNLSDNFLKELDLMPSDQGVTPYEQTFKQLRLKGMSREVGLVEQFLQDYGDRSFEELKLESLPLKNDPGLFKSLLKWGKQNEAGSHSPKSTVSSVELGFLDKKVIKFTRECIEFRESSRLWRGRFYHFLRQLMITLAGQLYQEDPLWRKYQLRDFFSVNHKEWMAFAHNELSQVEVMNLMDTRQWQNKQQHYPEFACWAEKEKLPQVSSHTLVSDEALKGQGVSPGVIEAQALVLENPSEILGMELGDFILVTKNTDPAWVYIMSRSKGLISEKGSMLSHTAIIGRELGIPTLVGVKGATHRIKTGDRLRIDGTSGEVTVV